MKEIPFDKWYQWNRMHGFLGHRGRFIHWAMSLKGFYLGDFFSIEVYHCYLTIRIRFMQKWWLPVYNFDVRPWWPTADNS